MRRPTARRVTLYDFEPLEPLNLSPNSTVYCTPAGSLATSIAGSVPSPGVPPQPGYPNTPLPTFSPWPYTPAVQSSSLTRAPTQVSEPAEWQWDCIEPDLDLELGPDTMISLQQLAGLGATPKYVGKSAAEQAAIVLDNADKAMRQHVYKGGGDAAAPVLYSCLLDLTPDPSGPRALVELAWSLLEDQACAAASGNFATDLLPNDFESTVMADFQGEPHRKTWLHERLQELLYPDGKSVGMYLRDRQSGQLVPAPAAASAASAASAPISAAAAERAERLLITQLEAACNKLQDFELREPAELLFPQDYRPDPQVLTQAYADKQAAQAELERFATANNQYSSVRSAANKHLSTPVPPPSVPPSTPATGGAASAAAARPGLQPPVPLPLQPELDTLCADASAANDTYEELQRIERTWVDYDAYTAAMQRYNGVRQRMEVRVADLNAQLDQMRQQQSAANTAQSSAQSAQPKAGQLQGYWSPTLRTVLSPSLLIYYIMRTVYKAAFQLAGQLDQEGYLRLKMKQGQSLRDWGGQVRAMAASFPNLRPEQHRGVYLDGLADASLRREITNFRKTNPAEGNTLESVILLSLRLVDREVELLRETIDSKVSGETERSTASNRLEQLVKLLGSGQSSSSAATPDRDKPDRPKPTRDPPKLPSFRDSKAYHAYCQARCVIHPNGRHTNLNCNEQHALLSKKMPMYLNQMAALASRQEPAVPAQQQQLQQPSLQAPQGPGGYQPAFSAAAWNPGVSSYAPSYSTYPQAGSSSYPQPYYPAPQSVYPPSSLAPSETGFTVGTVRQQRQQGLLQGGRAQQQGYQRQNPQPLPGLIYPPPTRESGPCPTCGWNTRHWPYVCAYECPHLASPGFRAPTVTTRAELRHIYAHNAAKMPPGMTLGGELPKWIDMHKGTLGDELASRMQRDVARMPRIPIVAPAAVAVPAYAPQEYVTLTCLPAMASELAALCQQQQGRLGNLPALNPKPPAVAAAGGPTEYAAAFPQSFVQLPDGPQPNQGTTKTSRPLPAGSPGPHTPPASASRAALANRLLQTLAAFTQQLQEWVGKGDEPAGGPASTAAATPLPPAAAPTASAATAAPSSSSSGRVCFAPLPPPASGTCRVDELEINCTRALQARLPSLATELQDLMSLHNVGPDTKDPHGLYSIHMQLCQGKRMQLDAFENRSVQTGFSVVLVSGELVVLADTKSDSGASMCLVSRPEAERVGWPFYPTSIKLALADSTLGDVAGITAPAWGMLAAGTPHEAKAMMQALVVEPGLLGKLFGFVVAKDYMYATNACVLPHEQLFTYQADAGHRHGVPIQGYQPWDTVAAGHCAIANAPSSFALTNASDVAQVVADFWKGYGHPIPPSISSSSGGANIMATAAAASAAPAATNPQLEDYTHLPTAYALTGLAGVGAHIQAELSRAAASADFTAAAAGASTHPGVHTAGVTGECMVPPVPHALPEPVQQCMPCEQQDADTFYDCLPEDEETWYDALSTPAAADDLPDLVSRVALLFADRPVSLFLYYPVDYMYSPAACITVEVSCNLTAPAEPAELAAGRAAALAAAAGLQRESLSASSVPPDPVAPSKRMSAGDALSAIGYEPPHIYYRAVTWVGSTAVFLLQLLLIFLLGVCDGLGCPTDLLSYLLGGWWQCLWAWWCRHCRPVPDFEPPPSQCANGMRRCDSTRTDWVWDYISRRNRGKPLTASLVRHARRYLAAVRQHRTAKAVHAAATLSAGISVWLLCPLFLLTLVSLPALAGATPSTVQGFTQATNNLAAWELSHLAGWRFLPCSLLPGAAPHGS